MFSKTFFPIATLSAITFSVAQAQLATVCANVAISLPFATVAGINLLGANLGSLCLCEDVATASLTPISVQALSSAITGAGLLGNVGDALSSILEVVEPTGLTAVNQATASCTFPDNAVSTCSGTDCSFTCPSGDCVCPTGFAIVNIDGTNSRCVAASASQRKRRSEMHARSFGACPFQQTACAIPGSASSKTVARRGYECLDLQANIESCGGCRFPLAGEPVGTDCTEILHTDSVSCVAAQCVIDSCRSGFTISEDGSKCIEASLLIQ